uniref:JEKYLL protein n=1 Tax=Hordeum vulgare TaxID=4513 RepID=Q1EL78_HORVU|nr:JEKYLL protein precursor [Hordeum vulgare subsp. vulgare]
MAARGGKALVLAMLISFLAVQGTLGDLHKCFCGCYTKCMKQTAGHDACVKQCMNPHGKCFFGCRRKSTPSMMALADHVNPDRDEDTMTVAAEGADHGKFNVTEGSMAVPAGGADHGEFNVTEGSMAALAGGCRSRRVQCR